MNETSEKNMQINVLNYNLYVLNVIFYLDERDLARVFLYHVENHDFPFNPIITDHMSSSFK